MFRKFYRKVTPPVVEDLRPVDIEDENGQVTTVFEPYVSTVDYGLFTDWSLNALQEAGVNPAVIMQSTGTRAQGSSTLENFKEGFAQLDAELHSIQPTQEPTQEPVNNAE